MSIKFILHEHLNVADTWFRRTLLFRKSNVSSSRLKQTHMLPKTRSNTVKYIDCLRCVISKKIEVWVNSYHVSFFLVGNFLCFFHWFALGDNSFVGFYLPLSFAVLWITIGFFATQKEKIIKTDIYNNDKISLNWYCN